MTYSYEHRKKVKQAIKIAEKAEKGTESGEFVKKQLQEAIKLAQAELDCLKKLLEKFK